jgi:hypothetical protein
MIPKVLAISSFIEAVGILVLTAMLTGLLVPIIKGRMDARKAQQTKIIDAQAELLDGLTEILWEFRMLVSQIAYYRERGDTERYGAAFKAYDRRGWDVFARFRTLVSIGRRLTSGTVHTDLMRLYEKTLTPIDEEINELAGQDRESLRLEGTLLVDIDEKWQALHDRIRFKLTDELEAVLIRLALELRLIKRGGKLHRLPESARSENGTDS